jgi:hypothetical protein
MPVNDDIGHVPEFPTQRLAGRLLLPQRILTELKGKLVDPSERGNPTYIEKPQDWLNQWTGTDDSLAEASHHKSTDPDASLVGMWDNTNQRSSLQHQNLYLRQYRIGVRAQLNEQTYLVDELEQ